MLSFVWKHFCFFWISQVDSHCRLLLRLGVVLVFPGFFSCYDDPNPRRPSSVKLSKHVGAPVYPTPLLLFTQVMGHQMGTFSYAKAVVKNGSETSWWNLNDILYFSVCHFWVLLNQGLYPRDVFWGNSCCQSTTTVIVFQRSRSRLEPPENSGSGWWLISKIVLNFESTLEKIFLGSSHNTP